MIQFAVGFVLTTRQNGEHLRLDSVELGMPLHVLYLEDATHAPFIRALNESNQRAFGGAGMGMPRWVMLDCGILPGAIVGFALPVEHTPSFLLEKLEPGYAHEFVPISEYCASPMFNPGSVSGFSLQCQLEGFGLATRTKALALWVYDAKTQIGVTQYDNAAILVHSKFGPLSLQMHQPCIHTHAAKSFVYELAVPDPLVLVKMAQGTQRRVNRPLLDVSWTFNVKDPSHHLRLQDHLTQNHLVWITQGGWRMSRGDALVDLCVDTNSKHEMVE